MDWTATITSVENDPNIPQTIDVLVDYTDGSQTVSEKYTYTSVNLTDAAQVTDQVQSRLAAFNSFDSIVSSIQAQVGQQVSLQVQDGGSERVTARPVELHVAQGIDG